MTEKNPVWEKRTASERPRARKRPNFPWQVLGPTDTPGAEDTAEQASTQSRPPLDSMPETGYPQSDVDTLVSTKKPLSDTHISTVESHGYPTGKVMGIHRKEGRRRSSEQLFTLRADADLLKKIKGFCLEHGLTHKEVYERMAIHLLEHMDTPLIESFADVVGIKIPHDDMKISRTNEDIVMAYERISGNRWTRKDDAKGKVFNQTDIRLIEIAMISTVQKKLTGTTSRIRIGTFGYFIPEIQQLIEDEKAGILPKNFYSDYYDYVRQTWEGRIRKKRDEAWNKPKQTNS